MIGPLSRYAPIEQVTLVLPDGREIRHLRRRFLPLPERLALLAEVEVGIDDRLDRIAASHLGDPELSWRVADGNRALHPDELTERPGRPLRVTLPEGIPGVPHG